MSNGNTRRPKPVKSAVKMPEDTSWRDDGKMMEPKDGNFWGI